MLLRNVFVFAISFLCRVLVIFVVRELKTATTIHTFDFAGLTGDNHILLNGIPNVSEHW